MPTREPRSLIALLRGGPLLIPVRQREVVTHAPASDPPPCESLCGAELEPIGGEQLVRARD